VTPAQKIEKLEALLVRIRENARRPRVLHVVSTQTAAPVPLAPELEEEPPTAVTPAAESSLDRVAAEASASYEEPAYDEEEGEYEDEQPEEEEDELLDEDIVDLTDMSLEGSMPAEAETGVEAGVEESPSASPRPRLPAASMDEALTGAAAEGREPLKTVPPESGSQVASSAFAEPPEAVSSAARISGTTEVEPSPGPDLKLTGSAGAAIGAEAASTARATHSPVGEAAFVPEVVSRPSPIGALPPEFIGEAQRFKPQSFVELLDASLAL
jgi:hypothetical protein